MKKPRSSAKTFGSMISTPGSEVSMTFKAADDTVFTVQTMAAPQLLFASRPLTRRAAEPLRVALTSANPLRRAALVMRLSVFDDLVLIETAEPRNADVVLADAIDRFAAPTVILVDDNAEAAQAIARGARGVLLRRASPGRLHNAVHAV